MVAVLWRCRWGRLCLGGVGGAVWSHGCCGRAGLLGVPVGGGPPASRPRRELRSARRLEARPGPAAAHGHRSQAVPTRWPGCLKPPSPLRVRNGRFWCSFRVQWRCRFQRCLVGGEQWCCWFQRRHVVAPRARKSSPCALKTPQNRRFYVCWASFFAEEPLEGPCWASFFAPIGPASILDAMRCTSGWLRWGFCAMRSPLTACRRRVGGLDGVIPPDWWR